MINRARTITMKLLLACLAVLFSAISTVYAQPGDPGGGGDPDVPISGIEILLALGGLFGVSRFFTRSKAK
jgi:hypothetical protein